MGDAIGLGPAGSAGTGGIEGVDDAGSGSVADRDEDTGMWGSSTGTARGG